MEVRKSFPKRVKALAESTPREAIANLLSALMPRVPAATRPPSAYNPPDTTSMEAAQWGQPDPMAKLQRKRAPRTRAAASASYEVLRPNAQANHQMRSWRRAMVHAVVANTNQRDALRYLDEIYPQHKAKGIDFAWCAAQGYIKY